MKNKLKELQNCMKLVNETAMISTTDEKLKDILLKIIYDDCVGGLNDMSYNLCYEAQGFFEMSEGETIEEMTEKLENYFDFASIYYNEQLAYLNANNQDEILDILKEYDCDSISNACAIWFETKVKEVIQTLIDEYLTK
jgi:hypothetical protein